MTSTRDPDGITECYSDHLHDIRFKGNCDFCGSSESDVVGHILPHIARLKNVDPVLAAEVVIRTGGAKMVDGVLLDYQTARAIKAVADALSEENRARFRAMSLVKAATVSWKLVSKK